MFEIPVEAFEYTDEFEMDPFAGLELEEEYRRRSYGRGRYRPRRRPYARPRPARPPRPPRPPRRPPRYPWPRPRPPVRIVEPAPYPVPEPAPPQGSEYIRWVQSSLNAILGLRLPIDGIMGPRTRDAIRDFQRRRGLPADGIVGPDTERALLAARRGQAPPRGSAQRAEFEMLESGYGLGELEAEVNRRSRDYIRWVQSSLNRILGLRLAVDGVMGPKTRSAIRDFQRRSRLTVDGIVGPQTESALLSCGVPPLPGMSGSQTIEMPPVVVRPCPRLPKRVMVDGYRARATRVGSDQVRQLVPIVSALLRSLSKGCIRVRRVLVIGHASTEGSQSLNRQLGQRRAEAVRNYLEASLGVISALITPPIVFEVRSEGEQRPIIPTERTERDRKRNRRVEVTLLP